VNLVGSDPYFCIGTHSAIVGTPELRGIPAERAAGLVSCP
jgi:hypothetical protein